MECFLVSTFPFSKGDYDKQAVRIYKYTEVSHVVQVRAEGPKAPSPGHRPGYNGNQQGAL